MLTISIATPKNIKENKDDFCSKDSCPFAIDHICCWTCSIGSQYKSACNINPNECEQKKKG